MSKENEKTLRVYDKLGGQYIKGTALHIEKDPDKAQKKRQRQDEFLKKSFSLLAPRDKIFDIGSGGGEDAESLVKLGYRVTASDVSEYFLDEIRRKKIPCRKFDVLKDEFDKRFDGMLAWRVFVHFTPQDLEIACRKIYDALRLGGIFVFNVFNKEADGGKESGWYDFDNEYRIGADRFFYYYKEEQVEKIIKDAGFIIREKKLQGGKEADKWFVFVLEKPTGVRVGLQKYIEAEILPQYKKLSGHTDDHIEQVISRSFAIATELEDVNIDMVYTVAAYHDLGRLVDNKTHNLESGKMMMEDQRLREFFSEEQIKIMTEAVEDHRASLEGDPRNVYGKIVSSADRDTDVEEMIRRSYKYNKLNAPDMKEDEIIENTRIHLREKYTPEGYGAKKVYFPTDDTKECFRRIEEITRDPKSYRELVRDLNS